MRTAHLAVVCCLVGSTLHARAEPAEPPVGFFNSYPSVDVGMAGGMPKVGASLLTCIAGGFSMNPAEGQYDFAVLDKQIKYAAEHALPLSIISELNPYFAPPWLVAKAKAAGELVRNASGAEGAIPSISSHVFSRSQEQLVQRVTEHLRQHPNGKIVQYIHPGAEWWFPYSDRYHPAEIASFRKWLSRQYASIGELNLAWDSKYRAFDEVVAPRLESVGNLKDVHLLCPAALDNGYCDCSWSTPQATDPTAVPGQRGVIRVTPGRSYTFTAWVKGEQATGRGAYLELAWVGKGGGRPIGIDPSPDLKPGATWKQLLVRAIAPKDAQRAWLLLKFAGTGGATFDEVRFVEQSGGTNLAPNAGFEAGAAAPEDWTFQNWTGGGNVESAYQKQGGRENSACVRIRVKALDAKARGYANDHAAVFDWAAFWNETAAEYVNRMSALVKRFDRTRTTVSYLTYSFAFPAEWDYTQQVAVAPDEVARRGRDIDVLGMQLCSADSDPYRATCCLDVVRKYGKPMWVVDLVDFTSGVHVGLPAMEKVTQAVVAHGAEGIVYCGWHLTFVQDYSYWPGFPDEGLHRMVAMAREAIQRTRGLKMKPAAALVHTMMPMSALDGPEGKNDFRSFIGWYKVLEAMHETVDVVTLRELELDSAVLDRYPYVVVPDCPYLPRRAMRALRAYGDRGGLLVTTERFGLFNEFGRPMLNSERNGVKRVEVPDDGRAYTGTLTRDTHAGNTPPLFLWRGETADTRAALARAVRSIGRAKQQNGVSTQVALAADDPNLRCVHWVGKDRQLVYLVNMGSKPSQQNELLLREAPGGAIRVLADMKSAPNQAAVENGVLRVRLPSVNTCCLVEITGSIPEPH
ncbi:MAG: beta-galactosidase [Thermoguttaceae bacterium]